MPDWIERLKRFYGPLPQPPEDAFALYVWEVLGGHTTPSRRDVAMNALRRIPALTPDSMSKVARMKLERAVALAGPYREERLRALNAGVGVFRRHPDLPSRLLKYLAHHGQATCVVTPPLCRICPLHMGCPFPKGAAA